MKISKNIYEYTAILNGEEVKAEYCFSNLYGSSYCVIDGYRYNDIPYSSKVLGVEQVDISRFTNILIPFLFIIIFSELIKLMFKRRY